MGSTAQSLSRGFALAGAIPLIAISLLSIAQAVPRFVDPCFSWGEGTGQSINRRQMSDCRGRKGGTSATIAGAVTGLILVQGTALATAVLGLKGGYRSRPRLTLAACIILLLLSVPLIVGTSGLITLVCAMCFLFSYLFSYLVRTASA